MERTRTSIDAAEYAAFRCAWRATLVVGLITTLGMVLIYRDPLVASAGGLIIGVTAGALGLLLGFVYALPASRTPPSDSENRLPNHGLRR